MQKVGPIVQSFNLDDDPGYLKRSKYCLVDVDIGWTAMHQSQEILEKYPDKLHFELINFN